MSARSPETVVFGPYRFVPGDGLWRDGRAVPVPPRALGVLTTLLATPGEVVSKQALMDAVWRDTFVTESSLLEAIGLLRDTLGDDRKQPTYIQTVHRRGYRFIGQLAPAEEAPTQALKPPNAPKARQARYAWLAAALCIAIAWTLFAEHPVERRVSRFSISLPQDATIDPQRGSVAVSLDGSRLAYVSTTSGRSQLYLRSMDRDEPVPIAGTDGASDPFFSPNGEWLGFFAHGNLQKVRVDGGAPIVLCAAAGGAGATWTGNNTIWFGGGPGGGLAWINASAGSRRIGAPADISRSAGAPVVVATPAAGSRDRKLGWPDMLPGDRGVLFTSMTDDGSHIGVIDLRSGVRTVIAEQAAFARYSPTGHIVFERRGQLEAASFSLSTLATTSAPVPIVSNLSRDEMLDSPRFAFSNSGSLVYLPAAAGNTPRAELRVVLEWFSELTRRQS